jgi:hypothetical protein
MAPGRETYNIDALWAKIGAELDEAKLSAINDLACANSQMRLGMPAERSSKAW